MELRRRRFIIWRLIYLLIVLAGLVALYLLIPQDVLDAIRGTYFSKDPGGL
jgi:hypothetical protein